MTPSRPVTPQEALGVLARRFGVSTRYQDADRVSHDVPRSTVVEVLARLGIDASSDAAAEAAVHAQARQDADRLLPGTTVTRAGRPAAIVLGAPDHRASDGRAPTVTVHTEAGDEFACPAHRTAGRWLAEIPALTSGWHRLTATMDDRTAESVVVCAPDRIAWPTGVDRVWGWSTQLYTVRSRSSWGVGDYVDLADLARWSGRELGAGVVVCNPLHAAAPVLPYEASPYYPASRRYHSPLYLRVEATAEYRAAPPPLRHRVDALRPDRGDEHDRDRIDRDRVWPAKAQALELLFTEARSAARSAQLDAFRTMHGSAVEDFATYCALAERYGRRWQEWPPDLQRPDGGRVSSLRAELRSRIDFHVWLQLLCEEQLLAAGEVARASGLAIGIVHDVAVGVDLAGADAWAQPDLLVPGVTIGAPPDGFNQLGQDWRLPPWNPHRLAEAGYLPFRDMLRSALCGAGGLRVDHVLGLFRLWWIPADRGAAAGTYVRYDHDALLSVLALEADRAGAIVIGEDLGTVEPHVAEALAERGVLGSDVLWFARDDEDPARLRRPARWRADAAGSVTTHDLPTAAGFLTGEHVRLRARLRLLGRSEAEEAAHAAAERAALVDLLDAEGLLPAGADPPLEELIVALHALLGRTPCRIILAAPGDALGDLRQPNLPGTDRYPNWCLPLARPRPDGPDAPGGHDGLASALPVDLEEFMTSPRVHRLVRAMADSLRRSDPQLR